MIQSTYSCSNVAGLNVGLSCFLSGHKLTISNGLPSGATTGAELKFMITGVRNAVDTSSKSGFIITTEDSSGGNIDSISLNLTVTTPATIISPSVSANLRTVQEKTLLSLTFSMPVPLKTGCKIQVTFPNTMTVVKGSGSLNSVTGLGMFPASSFQFDVASNVVTILSVCSGYTKTDFPGILRFNVVQNPTSTQPTDSIQMLVTNSDAA